MYRTRYPNYPARLAAAVLIGDGCVLAAGAVTSGWRAWLHLTRAW